MLAKELIAQMPANVRANAEKHAEACGITLLEFVQQKIASQLSDEELDSVSGGSQQLDFTVRVDQRTIGPGIRVGPRF